MEFVKYFEKQADRSYRCASGIAPTFKFEQAWSDFTGAEWNFRWAESGLWAELSGISLSDGAKEQMPTKAGSGNSHCSALLTCSDPDYWEVNRQPLNSNCLSFSVCNLFNKQLLMIKKLQSVWLLCLPRGTETISTPRMRLYLYSLFASVFSDILIVKSPRIRLWCLLATWSC